MVFSDFNILTPNAMLGYGYRLEHFWNGIEHYKPSAIIVDSGSTDGGPYKLGMNKMTCGKDAYIRDLTPIIQACFHNRVKVLISSVGGDGSNGHVDEMFQIVRDIIAEQGYSLKVSTIKQDISRTWIKKRVLGNQSSPCGPVTALTVNEVDAAVEIVAQMGAEPFLEALKDNPDIILGGRAYDPSPFAAFSMFHGVDSAIAWHMGKIMECGGICAVPKGRSMIATMSKRSFSLTPLSPTERCTPLSVAAHTLYEKTRPDRLPGPGGILNLDCAKYVQCSDDRTVHVSGAHFIPSPTYQIKLEGVRKLGFRTIFIGGIRDPILISQIDSFLDSVRAYSQRLFPELDKSEGCRLHFHIYGRNAVMGSLEPEDAVSHEIGILGEVVADTQERSHAIANNVRTSLLHMPYDGQLATTGNFASPLSPHEQAAGGVFRFNVYHLIDLDAREEVTLFPIQHHIIGSDHSPQPAPPRLTSQELDLFQTLKPAPLSVKQAPNTACQMSAIASVVRSKNSGPFELTLDIMFDSSTSFNRVKSANLLTNETIKKLYQLQDGDILVNMYFEPALAWKATVKRWPQGSFAERDTLGTQQHAPLLSIMVPAVDGA